MKIGWNRRKVAVLLSLCTECPIFSSASRLMDIIIWNSRGALKPNFQSYVGDLVHDHNPAIMVVMETKIGGARAKEITDRLPFDGAIHMNTIGYARGLWLLWNSDKVDITELANIEQEIHVEVKVRFSNLS